VNQNERLSRPLQICTRTLSFVLKYFEAILVFCLAIQREFAWNDEQLFDSMMRGCPTTNP
jgi:hypothetical protein